MNKNITLRILQTLFHNTIHALPGLYNKLIDTNENGCTQHKTRHKNRVFISFQSFLIALTYECN